MLHHIREAMKRDPLVGLMSGTIVADETFIGGKPKNKHQQGKGRAPVGAGARKALDNKTADLSLIDDETGEVRSRVVNDVSSLTLRDAITEQVDVENSKLMTDEWRGYTLLGREFADHQTVSHHRKEYVRYTEQGVVTSNRAEGYFSQLKRSLDGTHHHVSKPHLEGYLAEFDFRYTHRKISDTARMRLLMAGMPNRRLTYRPLIGG